MARHCMIQSASYSNHRGSIGIDTAPICFPGKGAYRQISAANRRKEKG